MTKSFKDLSPHTEFWPRYSSPSRSGWWRRRSVTFSAARRHRYEAASRSGAWSASTRSARWLTFGGVASSDRRRGALGTPLLQPFDPGQPGRCTLRVEPGLDPIRGDGGDVPAAASPECSSQLLLTDGMWPTGIRSGVTETEHVQVRAGARHRRQTRHVVAPLLAVERVEQPAVEHRLEDAVQALQVQGIANPNSASRPRRAAFSRAIDSAVSATSTPSTCSPSEAT